MMLPNRPRPTAVELMQKLSSMGLRYQGQDINKTFCLSRLGTMFKTDRVSVMYDPKRRPVTQMWLNEARFQAETDGHHAAVAFVSEHGQWRVWLELNPREFAQCVRALEHLRLKDAAAKGKSTHP